MSERVGIIESQEGGLCRGSFGVLVRFGLPYMLSCFLQSFYGLADLYFVGRYHGASAISAVSIGSQVIHLLTVAVCGLCMGATVGIGRSVGSGDTLRVRRMIGNTCLLFGGVGLVSTCVLLVSAGGIVRVLQTPAAAVSETRSYLMICFLGFPFITAYNVIGGIYRGLGNSVRPMVFVAIAGVLNVFLDYVLVGVCGYGASGAAWATVLSQAFSVALGGLSFRRLEASACPIRSDFRLCGDILRELLHVGIPIFLQDGFIQVSFLVITMIANRRGLEVSAAVGIVEKFIGFLFLVPSAMLSSLSALVSQAAGGGRHGWGRTLLRDGLWIVLVYGVGIVFLCHGYGEVIVGLFASGESEVIRLGADYLRGYSYDCAVAGVHFCFSGYFCAYHLAGVSFFHNVVSIVTARIPGAYLAWVWWPATLFPMGLAVAIGSGVSVAICLLAYGYFRRQGRFDLQ